MEVDGTASAVDWDGVSWAVGGSGGIATSRKLFGEGVVGKQGFDEVVLCCL